MGDTEKALELIDTSDEAFDISTKMSNPIKKKPLKRMQTLEIAGESWTSFVIRVILQYILLSVPGVGFGMIFTEIGYGATVSMFLSSYSSIGRLSLMAGFGILFVAYCLDISYWRGTWTYIRAAVLTCAGGFIAAGGATYQHPACDYAL